MKTPMQELMQWMEETEFMVNKGFIDKVNECLKIEKEHIRSAYNKGRFNALDGLEISSAEYFDQTYNQNK